MPLEKLPQPEGSPAVGRILDFVGLPSFRVQTRAYVFSKALAEGEV